jgi:hypothetical protein
MAEQISTQRRYINQNKNKNLIGTTITTTTNINIPPDMMEMIGSASAILYNLTSSVSYISQSLHTQSIQLNDLSSTSNLVRINKTFSNKETPVGEINGINTTYILQNDPFLGSEHLYLNGVLIEEGSNTDYNISGSIITFDEPLPSGSKLSCTYYYNDTTPVKIFVDKEIPSGSIDGTNNIFELTYLPVLGSEHLYLNGVLQESGNENDYTISDSTITFKEAPPTDIKLRCTYYYML